MTVSLTARFGWVHERRVFVQAAILAADATRGVTGFAPSDVRFFFLLFTNWVEHDVLHPEQDLELTQARRALERLIEEGWAARIGRPKKKRGTRYALRDRGVLGLASALDDAIAAGRPFGETLFVISYAASYGAAIRARVRSFGTGRAKPARASTLLDPRHLVLRALQRARALQNDLDERIRSGRELSDQITRASSDEDALSRLDAALSYQLHRVRPLGALLRALPPDLRTFELDEGVLLRVRFLFEPLAARVRTEITALESIEKSLRAPAAAKGRRRQ